MPRGSLIMRFRRLIPALTCVTAAIAVLVIWSIFAPFTGEIFTWVGSNAGLLSLGVVILTIPGYVDTLHRQVHEGLPQDILTLHAGAMRRLNTIESQEYIFGKSLVQISRTSTVLRGKPLSSHRDKQLSRRSLRNGCNPNSLRRQTNCHH